MARVGLVGPKLSPVSELVHETKGAHPGFNYTGPIGLKRRWNTAPRKFDRYIDTRGQL